MKNETRSGHYQHEEIHTISTGEIVFYSFFLTYYISNFEGNNCWKSVNFVLTLVSDTDYIITYIQHATLKEYEYVHRLLYTPGKDYVIETNGSNCPIIPSSPYQPIIITHTRLSILVD